ncbi:MAG: phosphoribosylformylglycinamidine cyclo-ligase [Candidatus Diapherotrites archaeon]|nr:phosphoribosylformylglycinamidine cyclo-ligase [Candidatus Diapherotrites archaeon]
MNGITYKDAGVDIDAGNEAVKRLKAHAERTFNDSVLLGIGHFSGAIDAEMLKAYKQPVIVGSIDGVGTKTMVASLMDSWGSIGKDLVNHSANDILCTGAKPLFFLDYIASSHLKPTVIEQIVKGMSEACAELNMPLIGGETAEMPGVYEKGQHDIVGCITGILEKARVIDGSKTQKGDKLIGLASNGLHTNGFSLARKVLFDVMHYNAHESVAGLDCSIGEELLKVHRCYSNPVLPLFGKFDIKGIAHITGGGFIDNIPRIIPKGLAAHIHKKQVPILDIFKLIQRCGNVPEAEMFRTFNMGVGLVLVVPEQQADGILQELEGRGETCHVIGEIVEGEGVKLV